MVTFALPYGKICTNEAMDLIEFRNYCLSLAGVTEKTPFGKFSKRFESILAFYVEGHMFCIIDIDNFHSVDIYCTPEKKAALEERYISVGAPVNKSLRSWIEIRLGGDILDHQISELVARSYSLIKAKYSKNSI